jgi:flagellar hook-basal body complex protein FliE
MSEIGNSKLLSEMRLMAARARGDAQNITNGSDNKDSFSGILKNALEDVNNLSQKSGELKEKFTLGDPSVSLIDTMVASQKAGLAFDATLQVRNKLVQAYTDIMNMPI